MNLGISKALDYNLYSNTERADFVRNLFTPELEHEAKLHYEEASTKKELEAAANYILYGKDPKTDKNFVQKKEVQIDQKYGSYKRKEMESLDQLLEDPTIRETDFQPIKRNCYKKIKPTIDREKDKNIPGMVDLWNAIDALAARVKELKDSEQLGLEFYKKNHLLIQLRKEQFVLKDSVVELIRSKGYHPTVVDLSLTQDTGYVRDFRDEFIYKKFKANHYRSTFGEEWYARQQHDLDNFCISENDELNWEYVEVSENLIDFRDPNHVYQFLELYSSLVEYCDENLSCDLKFLIWELEEYIDKTKLSPARRHILIRKIDKATNTQIRRELQQLYGICYSDNYISTIYTQMICGQIAKTAQLAFDYWVWRNNPEKFKVCSTCGTKLLRDTRNFVKKQTSKDGLSARCKSCDKRIRDERKKGKE